MNLIALFRLLRPVQWLKNLMLFFPPFLGGELFQPGVLSKGIVPFAAFCCASSATYVFNDLSDREQDARHPTKCRRPIAAGKVSVPMAAVLIVVLFFLALCGGLLVSRNFLYLMAAYVLISLLYSLKLKHFPLVDIFCISTGFLLRLEAGGEVFGIAISDWLFLSVFLLSLFLSTGKRLSEKRILKESAADHRQSLGDYPPGFLEGAMYMTAGAVLVTYTMYVISRKGLLLTVPLCTFGLMRYMLRVQQGQGGDPTESLTKDAPLFVVGLLWAVMVGWVTYCR